MSKIFEWDAKQGTFIDSVSGKVGVNNNGVFNKCRKGVCWRGNGSNSYLNFSFKFDYRNGAKTLIVFFRNKDVESVNSIISQSTDVAPRRLLYTGSGFKLYTVQDGDTLAGSSDLQDGKYYMAVLTTDTNGDRQLFLNNNFEASDNISYDESPLSEFYIGANSDESANLDGDVLYSVVLDKVASQQEINSYYRMFLRSAPVEKPVRNFKFAKPTDLSNDEGLIAAYNMIPSPDQKLVDISGNGNDGAITKAIPRDDGLYFNGVDAHTELSTQIIPANYGSWTVEVIVNPLDIVRTHNNILSGYFLSFNSDYKLESFDGDAYQIANTSLVQNKKSICTMKYDDGTVYFYIDGVFAGSTSYDNSYSRSDRIIYIVDNGQNSKCVIDRVLFWNYAKDESEIISRHNQFARRPYLNLDFSNDSVGDTI